ncbi:unnamed protein product (macronuclear) [Paramecium tetraurelia]|uniref:Uncharacterized protein n=1 Tax=Paramecium tetraurelia TaxID=5888 RepID=A0E7V3_PARTE|nr:uncharacterized protein GSPATT00024098001 [Paramecium tetraurelia]CAK91370.1 unnamed protein product [Paramecium tetraurelia]|eukprot:XP_001458767.1 hypothetical protein (macronuclear) [Paramecium tetraurelia strain d4-2]
MEEFEILDFHELQVEKQGLDQASKYLQKKIQNGFKVSIVIKKQHNFALPPLQQKKNDLFSKHHQPVDLVSQSSEVTENNDKHGSSTSSNQSIKIAKNQIISPTQNETPEQHPNEQISQQSEDEPVSFDKSKTNSFEQLLKDDLLNQKLRTGLQFLRDGKFKLALERMMEVYKEGNEKLKQQAEKLQISVIILLCVQSLCYASQILKELGQINEALKCLDKCLNQFEINDFDVLSKIYIEKANLYLLNNQYLQSLDYYKKALNYYEQVNWKLDIAKILVKISFVYALLHDSVDAKKICYEGLSILQNKLDHQDPRIFDTYYTLGCIYYLEKEYDFALEYLEQSKDGFIKLYGQKHEQLCKIMNLQGVIYHLQGSSVNAIEIYEQLVTYYGDTESIGLALIMNNLALAYLDRMKFKSANLLFAKAITILKSYFNENHPAVQRIEKNKMLVASATLSYM